MLPPVDPTVLKRNPNFDFLYKDLSTRKLNPDASTRDTKRQRIHDEIRQVRTYHVSFVCMSIVLLMITTVSLYHNFAFDQ